MSDSGHHIAPAAPKAPMCSSICAGRLAAVSPLTTTSNACPAAWHGACTRKHAVPACHALQQAFVGPGFGNPDGDERLLHKPGAKDSGFEAVWLPGTGKRFTLPETGDHRYGLVQDGAALALIGLVAQIAKLLLAAAHASPNDKTAIAKAGQRCSCAISCSCSPAHLHGAVASGVAAAPVCSADGGGVAGISVPGPTR